MEFTLHAPQIIMIILLIIQTVTGCIKHINKTNKLADQIGAGIGIVIRQVTFMGLLWWGGFFGGCTSG